MSYAKPTPKQLAKIAEVYVLKGNKAQAVREAFPNNKAQLQSIRSVAVKIFKLEEVKDAIEKIRKEVTDAQVENVIFTVAEAIKELDENRGYALEKDNKGARQVAAANGATMGKAKILGLYSDKIELSADDKLEAALLGARKRVGR